MLTLIIQSWVTASASNETWTNETTVLHGAQQEKYACVLRPVRCSVFTIRRVHDSRWCLCAKCPTKKSTDWQRNLQSDLAVQEICTNSSHSCHPCQSCRPCHCWGSSHSCGFHHVVDDGDDDSACLPRMWLHCWHCHWSCKRKCSLMGLCRNLSHGWI